MSMIQNNIAQLISQMTLEEKASLCTGATPWRTVGIEHLETLDSAKDLVGEFGTVIGYAQSFAKH